MQQNSKLFEAFFGPKKTQGNKSFKRKVLDDEKRYSEKGESKKSK